MDLKDCADRAILLAILHARPPFTGGWRNRKPSNLEPPLMRPGDWVKFVGYAIYKYNGLIAPDISAGVAEFVDLYDETFLKFRNALVKNTVVHDPAGGIQ